MNRARLVLSLGFWPWLSTVFRRSLLYTKYFDKLFVFVTRILGWLRVQVSAGVPLVLLAHKLLECPLYFSRWLPFNETKASKIWTYLYFIINNLGENTEINTPDNVTSTLLSDFAFKIPSSRCQRKRPFDLIFGTEARQQQFSSELSQVVHLALNT